VHDFNPGFSPNGVLWSAWLPRDNPLLVDLPAGGATLIGDLDVSDYTKIPNSLALGAAVPAAVTFEAVWRGPISRDISVQDAGNGFRGQFLENQASLVWSASRAGFRFVSDAANTSTSVFAELGRERNGIFF
jgi:hypothetical protein